MKQYTIIKQEALSVKLGPVFEKTNQVAQETTILRKFRKLDWNP